MTYPNAPSDEVVVPLRCCSDDECDGARERPLVLIALDEGQGLALRAD